MAGRSVGTRPQTRYHNTNSKTSGLMSAGVDIGKGASKDKPRFSMRNAEAAP